MILGYAGKVAQMFSWSTMLAPPTWFANDPGGTRYGQMNRDAVQTTFRTRTAKSARLQVSRAHRAEATEGDTVRSTINLCRPRPPNDSLRELDRVPIEGGLAAGGAEVEGPALVNGAAGRPLRVHHHSADGIFFHGLLERTVPREPCGLSPRIPGAHPAGLGFASATTLNASWTALGPASPPLQSPRSRAPSMPPSRPSPGTARRFLDRLALP